MCAIMLAYKGAGSVSGSFALSQTPPSVTMANGDVAIVGLLGSNETNLEVVTAPLGYVDLADVFDDISSNAGAGIWLASKEIDADGAESPSVWGDLGGSGDFEGAFTIRVQKG
jgi:hypothetical protein